MSFWSFWGGFSLYNWLAARRWWSWSWPGWWHPWRSVHEDDASARIGDCENRINEMRSRMEETERRLAEAEESRYYNQPDHCRPGWDDNDPVAGFGLYDDPCAGFDDDPCGGFDDFGCGGSGWYDDDVDDW